MQKTFKAANLFLQNQMSHIEITWKFSAPLAPWWGGWWERLIRSIKSSLRKTLGKELVTRVENYPTRNRSMHKFEAIDLCR